MNDNAINDAYVIALHHLIPVTLPNTMIVDKSYVIINIKHARSRPGGINDMNPMGLREKISRCPVKAKMMSGDPLMCIGKSSACGKNEKFLSGISPHYSLLESKNSLN
jgi:hypothetical protein